MAGESDRGWAWVVLGMTAVCRLVDANVVISLGLLQVEFLHTFSSSTGLTSLIPSIFLGLQLMMGQVASVLCHVFSIRVTFMTGGLIFSLGLIASCFVSSIPHLILTFTIAGFGFGIVFTHLNVIIGHYFVRLRAAANGVSASAAGLGFALGPFATSWLLEKFGWRITVSVLACCTLQFCVAGATCFPTSSEIKSQRKDKSVSVNGNQSGSRLWFLSHPHWWIFCINYVFQMIAWSIQVVHFPSYVESQDVPLESITSLFTAFGICVTLSRALCGFLCNDDSVDSLLVLIGVQGLQGVTMFLMPFYGKTYAGLLAYQITVSLFYGAAFVPIIPVSVELFGVSRLSTVFGWVMMWGGLGMVAGPVLAGWIRDVFQSYSIGFHISGFFSIVESILLLFIPVIKVQNIAMETENAEKLLHENKLIIVKEGVDI